MTAESQMRGCAVMDIGEALLEASATDPRTARLLNPGLNKYLIPTRAESPRSTSPSSTNMTPGFRFTTQEE